MPKTEATSYAEKLETEPKKSAEELSLQGLERGRNHARGHYEGMIANYDDKDLVKENTIIIDELVRPVLTRIVASRYSGLRTVIRLGQSSN
jgi:hypothetical protein